MLARRIESFLCFCVTSVHSAWTAMKPALPACVMVPVPAGNPVPLMYLLPYLGGHDAQETKTSISYDGLFLPGVADPGAQRLWRAGAGNTSAIWWHPGQGRHLDR